MSTLSVEDWTGSAEITNCGTYRYSLCREFNDGSGTILWIMLNPSTADASVNDPTIRRCIGFSRAWGAQRVEVRNLFAYRSTFPWEMVADLNRGVDIVGPLNDERIKTAHELSAKTIVAWGAHPLAVTRGGAVLRRLLPGKPVFCLGTSRAGAPRHPLYVPGNFVPVEYRR